MKELTVQQIEHNWKKLRDIIQNTFDSLSFNILSLMLIIIF